MSVHEFPTSMARPGRHGDVAFSSVVAWLDHAPVLLDESEDPGSYQAKPLRRRCRGHTNLPCHRNLGAIKMLGWPNEEAGMPDKRFTAAVEIELGVVRSVASARSAAQALLDVRWPRRGPRHLKATETCLRILDGHRSSVDPYSAFVEAAREAGILRSH